MEPEQVLILVARWLHIVAATTAVGVPIFGRLALQPALRILPEESRNPVQQALAARWRVAIYLSIVIFLATGFYNFLGAHAHWRQFDRETEHQKMLWYHSLVGVKLVLAFVMFFLSSALAGRSAALASFRNHARTWTAVLVVLGLIVVGISNYLRFM